MQKMLSLKNVKEESFFSLNMIWKFINNIIIVKYIIITYILALILQPTPCPADEVVRAISAINSVLKESEVLIDADEKLKESSSREYQHYVSKIKEILDGIKEPNEIFIITVYLHDIKEMEDNLVPSRLRFFDAYMHAVWRLVKMNSKESRFYFDQLWKIYGTDAGGSRFYKDLNEIWGSEEVLQRIK